MGWQYAYTWALVLPAELNAAAVLIGYWNSSVNVSVWIAMCLVVAVAINLGGTKVYGGKSPNPPLTFAGTALTSLYHRG